MTSLLTLATVPRGGLQHAKCGSGLGGSGLNHGLKLVGLIGAQLNIGTTRMSCFGDPRTSCNIKMGNVNAIEAGRVPFIMHNLVCRIML